MEAGLDWTVQKSPMFTEFKGSKIITKKSALIRDNGKILDVVSNDWNIVQNSEAFDFFNDFVAAGDMEMHTAGALKDGQIVWALAKIKESFDVVKDDKIDSYMLFTNPHKYGWATSVSFTPIRVVCMNTLRYSLNEVNSDKIVRVTHSNKFDADEVKKALGISHNKLMMYKETAQFLASKQAKDEDIVEYFKRVFPITSSENKREKDVSRNAELAMDVLVKQPGSEYAAGSWWQPVNAVTYMYDHLIGHSNDNRLASAWYGSGQKSKNDAMNIAMDYAKAA